MKVLAIDQSYTSSGLVVFDGEEVIHAEVFGTDKNNDIFDRAWEIATHIKSIVNNYQIDHVAIEGLAFGMRGSATRDLAGLQFTIITNIKHDAGVPVTIVSPKTVKLRATGSGKADKKAMLEALPEKIKIYFGEELGIKKTKGLYDCADSYWIGMSVIDTLKKDK